MRFCYGNINRAEPARLNHLFDCHFHYIWQHVTSLSRGKESNASCDCEESKSKDLSQMQIRLVNFFLRQNLSKSEILLIDQNDVLAPEIRLTVVLHFSRLQKTNGLSTTQST